MTTHLVDTNALIFALINPTRLTETAETVLRNGDVDLAASAASIYEVGNKHRLGKLVLDPYRFIEGARVLGVPFLSVTDQIFLSAAKLDWTHRDPWDRIIAAHAIHLGANIITSDGDFDVVSGLKRLW